MGGWVARRSFGRKLGEVSMCGIVGLIDFRERPDPSRVQRAVAALAHRGPDHQGLWSDGQACLGHARLSVIDLDPRSHQPMVDADTGLVLVYNGEIYNFRELRRDLETRGVRFRTEGDSEVLLSAYKVWGLDCLLRLRGMFAFAVWDPGSRTLVLARDRVGKKPLVFSRTSERLVFASEIRALIALGGVDRSLDFEALDLFLCQSYIPAPWTIYRGVRKLEPGCWALMRSGCWETGRYWDPDFRIKQNPDEAQVEDQARSELERAVQERMISDVPLGVMLSGGLDSALVAALMARYSDRPVKSFTVGFDDPRYDEGNEARATAEYLGLDHHELRVESGRELGEVLPRVLGQFGEPYGDDSALPSYILSGMVRSEVTVVLNGDGGDELCG
ncbi:MAG: asparagine synthase (glutamine-hydrolyzing), partial [Deltaproteobacteria bacterium]|nr:asparagine synthase (glutamine-hydrolyzing) [Deltaproteobacteria bacterium]